MLTLSRVSVVFSWYNVIPFTVGMLHVFLIRDPHPTHIYGITGPVLYGILGSRKNTGPVRVRSI
ncbi:hypothetical protein ARMSODRAFT_81902 [Armillaria solidipes]|uniref:Uncharacterized protein n=1 Tax=Armillaria solidipes TaxID=1076256 RepID=A0A2H3B2P2_9AGAR|nr:hypothetical protein ARMSODRAFT_81902 [Armillaria solidipes]